MPYKSIEKKREAQRRYRERHPDVVENDFVRLKNWKQGNPYVPVVRRYCSCGVEIRREGKSMCLSCEKKAEKMMPIRCHKCGDVFIGDRRSKFCKNCKKRTLPSLLDAMRSYIQRRRAKRQGLIADFTQKDWREVKRHFNDRCAYCEREGKLEQDHFIPIVKGGAYTRKNIVPACKSCNAKKNDTLPWEWLPADKYRYIANYLGAR